MEKLVGYLRNPPTGDYLKVNLLLTEVNRSATVEGKDGTSYLVFQIRKDKIKKIANGELEVTSVVQEIP